MAPDFFHSTVAFWNVFAAVLAAILTVLGVRFTTSSIWRNNAEGYKAELDAQEERHRVEMALMQSQLDLYQERLEKAEVLIHALEAKTDLTPLLTVVPMIQELHQTLIAKVPATPTPSTP